MVKAVNLDAKNLSVLHNSIQYESVSSDKLRRRGVCFFCKQKGHTQDKFHQALQMKSTKQVRKPLVPQLHDCNMRCYYNSGNKVT